jgi:hypothetical protein
MFPLAARKACPAVGPFRICRKEIQEVLGAALDALDLSQHLGDILPPRPARRIIPTVAVWTIEELLVRVQGEGLSARSAQLFPRIIDGLGLPLLDQYRRTLGRLRLITDRKRSAGLDSRMDHLNSPMAPWRQK